jgi:hypothetical protein
VSEGLGLISLLLLLSFLLEWSIRMEQRMRSQRDPVGLLECDLEDRMFVSPCLEKTNLLLQH